MFGLVFFAVVGWAVIMLKVSVWLVDSVGDPWRGWLMMLWALAGTGAFAWAVAASRCDFPEMNLTAQIAVGIALFLVVVFVTAAV